MSAHVRAARPEVPFPSRRRVFVPHFHPVLRVILARRQRRLGIVRMPMLAMRVAVVRMPVLLAVRMRMSVIVHGLVRSSQLLQRTAHKSARTAALLLPSASSNEAKADFGAAGSVLHPVAVVVVVVDLDNERAPARHSRLAAVVAFTAAAAAAARRNISLMRRSHPATTSKAAAAARAARAVRK